MCLTIINNIEYSFFEFKVLHFPSLLFYMGWLAIRAFYLAVVNLAVVNFAESNVARNFISSPYMKPGIGNEKGKGRTLSATKLLYLPAISLLFNCSFVTLCDESSTEDIVFLVFDDVGFWMRSFCASDVCW